jgi:hypothetical protein
MESRLRISAPEEPNVYSTDLSSEESAPKESNVFFAPTEL